MLDYLGFWYVHRPPSMGIISFICQSKTFKNEQFYLKNECKDRGSNNNVLLLILTLLPRMKRDVGPLWTVQDNLFFRYTVILIFKKLYLV